MAQESWNLKKKEKEILFRDYFKDHRYKNSG